jgi:hypothetical protein
MKKLSQLFVLAGVILVLGFGSWNAPAQGQGQGARAFDPSQMQEQILEAFRTQLVVTNDEEWNVIREPLSKVAQLRFEIAMGGMGAMRGMFRNRGGDSQQAPRRFPGFGQPSPEADALQKAIDNNAPKDQLKAALASYREARKRKQDDLAKAQEQLRQLLSTHQEAVLVSMGMLD